MAKTPFKHKSFRRSYREDYQRPLDAPSLTAHAVDTFKQLFKNWKLFGGLLLTIMFFNVILVGLFSNNMFAKLQTSADEIATESTGRPLGFFAKAGVLLVSTVTTGGLSESASEVQRVFLVLIFLIAWLVTIYLLRHLLAGHKPRLRDGLFNALSPFLSTFVIFLIMAVECLPLFFVLITYSAALSTGFLSTPFYALIYLLFAALMFLISGYLLSSSIMSLVAVTSPGVYPLKALRASHDLMLGRRIRFIIRIIYLFFVLAIIYVVIMLPIICLDLWLSSLIYWFAYIPLVQICLLAVSCFAFIYAATYIYLFYRRMLNYDEQN